MYAPPLDHDAQRQSPKSTLLTSYTFLGLSIPFSILRPKILPLLILFRNPPEQRTLSPASSFLS